MDRDTAERFYDGAIPKGAVAPTPYVARTSEEERAVDRRIAEVVREERDRARQDKMGESRAILEGRQQGKTMIGHRNQDGRLVTLSVNPLSVQRARQCLERQGEGQGR